MRGLTLVETLFGALLTCIVFFVIMSLFPSTLFSLRKGHDIVAAANVAQQTLEAQRGLSFDQVAVGTFTLPDVTVDGTAFTPTLTVSSVRTDLKRVSAHVTWDASGTGTKTGTVDLETRIYRFVNR